MSLPHGENRVKAETPAVFQKHTNNRRKQPPKSFRTVFWHLFTQHENQPFELDASWLAEMTGYSRKTIYKALRFLRGVRLCECLEQRTGRGNHSVYRLRWRRIDASEPDKTLSSEKSVTSPRPYKERKSNHTLRCEPGWNRMMKSFRQLIDHAGWFTAGERRLFTALLGKRLKGKDLDWCRRLWQHLAQRLWQLVVPSNIPYGDHKRLAGWFMRQLLQIERQLSQEV